MCDSFPMPDQDQALRILAQLTRRSHDGPPVWANLRRELVRMGVRDPEGLVEGLRPVFVHSDGPLALSAPVRLTYDGLAAAERESPVLFFFIECVIACNAAYIRHEPPSPAIYEPVTLPERELLRPGLDAGTLALLRGLLEVEGICRRVPTANGARRYEVSERISQLSGVIDPDAYRQARFRVR